MKNDYGKYFPFLLIFSVLSAAIEIDLSIPSFPDIARAFAVSEDVVEGTISLNFLGFCISALLYGPLSDMFGRRPIMLVSTFLFLIGSACCSVAPNIEMILVARLIQGLGASGSFVVVFTMIADAYKDNEATRWIGLLNAILTGTMALAPIIGGYLNLYFGWSSCYTCIAMMTILQFFLLYFFLPETRPGTQVEMKEIAGDYKQLLCTPRFLQSALIPTLLAGGYMAFISVIPFLYRDELQMPLGQFSWHQASIIGTFSLTSYFANRIADFFGDVRSVVIGSLLAVASTASLSVLALFSFSPIPSPLLITPLMCLFAAGCAIPFAIVFSASLSIIPGKNGAASSLVMSLRTLLCAMTIQLAATMYDATLFKLSALVTVCCLISALLTARFYWGQLHKTLSRSAVSAVMEIPLDDARV